MEASDTKNTILRWLDDDSSRFEGDPAAGIDPLMAMSVVLNELPSLRRHGKVIAKTFSTTFAHWDGMNWSLNVDGAADWLLDRFLREVERDIQH